MPYFFDALSTPLDEEHFWERLEEIWRVMHDDLMGVHFETEEEALEKAYLKSLDPNDLRLDSLFVARYRDTDDRENLLLFHARGLEALAETEVAIANRAMTAQFMHDWSELLSCHGFVTAAVMARGPDVEGKRAGLAGAKAVSLDKQRQWFSHYYLRLRPSYGSRAETENVVQSLISAILDGDIHLDPAPDVAWFEKFLNLDGNAKSNPLYGQLTFAFRDNRLSVKTMRGLVELPCDHLPLLNLEVPRP
jgi:hypothetical protein